jgi:hypothetical protein
MDDEVERCSAFPSPEFHLPPPDVIQAELGMAAHLPVVNGAQIGQDTVGSEDDASADSIIDDLVPDQLLHGVDLNLIPDLDQQDTGVWVHPSGGLGNRDEAGFHQGRKGLAAKAVAQSVEGQDGIGDIEVHRVGGTAPQERAAVLLNQPAFGSRAFVRPPFLLVPMDQHAETGHEALRVECDTHPECEKRDHEHGKQNCLAHADFGIASGRPARVAGSRVRVLHGMNNCDCCEERGGLIIPALNVRVAPKRRIRENHRAAFSPPFPGYSDTQGTDHPEPRPFR